jgi:photosystem II stability/assembly factor-like uncharacterized protein
VFSQWNHVFTYNKQLYALDVVNPDTVFVVGWHCAIRTFDSGNTWADINYYSDDLVLIDVNFPTSKVGYIIGNSNIILKTENYGHDWEQVVQDTIAQLVEVDFISPDTGWIIGNLSNQGDVIMRTYDGGTSWNYYFPDPFMSDVFMLTDIQMLNSNIGYITHYEGILKTLDGGNSWFQLGGEFNGPSTCCSFINTDTGFIGVSGLFKTDNAGEDWEFLTEEHGIGYFARSQLQFINNDTGYYVGYDAVVGSGILCTTTDGGNNWNKGQSQYRDIEMYNNYVGYCIERTGEIYKTTEGGIVVGISVPNCDPIPTVYPNPFNNELFINITGSQILNKLPIVFEIFDIKGNKVYSKNIETPNNVINNINNLQYGIYIYLIKSENFILKSGKLLKTTE